MNIQNSKTFLVLATALSLAPFANGQIQSKEQAGPPPPSMVGLPGASRYGTDPLHLLQTAKVKQELKITDEQSTKLAKVADKYDREAASKLRGLLRGTLESIVVTRRGISPRIISATLTGSRGTTTISGARSHKPRGASPDRIIIARSRGRGRAGARAAQRP